VFVKDSGKPTLKTHPNKDQDAEVKIVQKCNGKRPSIRPLLRDFRRWLIQNRIVGIEELKSKIKSMIDFI
jgi:hypothetical protein